MSKIGRTIPAKLKRDAIVEAVFEIRFEMATATLPEVFIGRLADYPPWKGFRQDALPLSGVPPIIRQTDPNLRFQPIMQLSEVDGSRSVWIGQYAVSYRRAAPYVGWDAFRRELDDFFTALFEKSNGLSVSRLGLRYINALKEDLHGVRSVADLDLEITIAHRTLRQSVNVNYLTEHLNNTQSVVRVATKDLVVGNSPPGTVVLVDVDVYTKPGFKTTNIDDVRRWADFAHVEEKGQFFRLLKDETIDALEVK